MEAKRVKMKNLRTQKEYIQRLMDQCATGRMSGDGSILYAGVLYPEVQQYFNKLGWKSVQTTTNVKGLPIWLLSSADAALTAEELKEAWGEGADEVFGSGFNGKSEGAEDANLAMGTLEGKVRRELDLIGETLGRTECEAPAPDGKSACSLTVEDVEPYLAEPIDE